MAHIHNELRCKSESPVKKKVKSEKIQKNYSHKVAVMASMWFNLGRLKVFCFKNKFAEFHEYIL